MSWSTLLCFALTLCQYIIGILGIKFNRGTKVDARLVLIYVMKTALLVSIAVVICRYFLVSPLIIYFVVFNIIYISVNYYLLSRFCFLLIRILFFLPFLIYSTYIIFFLDYDWIWRCFNVVNDKFFIMDNNAVETFMSSCPDDIIKKFFYKNLADRSTSVSLEPIRFKLTAEDTTLLMKLVYKDHSFALWFFLFNGIYQFFIFAFILFAFLFTLIFL